MNVCVFDAPNVAEGSSKRLPSEHEIAGVTVSARVLITGDRIDDGATKLALPVAAVMVMTPDVTVAPETCQRNPLYPDTRFVNICVGDIDVLILG